MYFVKKFAIFRMVIFLIIIVITVNAKNKINQIQSILHKVYVDIQGKYPAKAIGY